MGHPNHIGQSKDKKLKKMFSHTKKAITSVSPYKTLKTENSEIKWYFGI